MTTQMPENDDRVFRELLEEAPMGSEAPDSLKRKLRSYAAYSRVRKARPWVSRLVIASACAVGLLAGTMLMWPTSASAKTFEKVLNATNRAKSFQISVDVTEGASRKRVILTGATGLLDLRTEDGKHAQLALGKVCVYDPDEQTLTVLKFGDSEQMKALAEVAREGLTEGLEQFDVKKMLAEFKARYGEDNGKVSDIYTEDGRQVYAIQLQSPKDASSVKITVDADTDLPFRIQARDQSGQDADMRIEFGVNPRIEPLEQTVPKNVTRREVDLGDVMNKAGAFGQSMLKFGSAMGNSSK